MKISISIKTDKTDLVEDDGPGIEKDDFHIENDEQHGKDVVPNRKWHPSIRKRFTIRTHRWTIFPVRDISVERNS